MTRIAVLIDRTPGADLGACLGVMHDALTLGGSRERRYEMIRPPFAALALSHDHVTPFSGDHDHVALRIGIAAPGRGGSQTGSTRCDDGSACEAGSMTLAREEAALLALARGHRGLVRWHPAEERLSLVTEANGLQPLYLHHGRSVTVIASEPKAIWALLPDHLVPDPDGVVEMLTVGHCLASRTLFKQIRCAEPGAIYTIDAGGVRHRTYHTPAPGIARRDDDPGVIADRLGDALLEVLEHYERTARRMTVALSGGVDSRFILAGARRVWSRLDAFTFGPPGSVDADIAADVASRARVPLTRHRTDTAYLSRWAPFAVWRMDGLASCIHAIGLDACIRQASESTFVLNGIGGELARGAHCRPAAFRQPGSARRAAQAILSRGPVPPARLADILKPEFLAAASVDVEDTLIRWVQPMVGPRLGDTLLAHHLRHHTARWANMGLVLESPFVEHLGPLVDPTFLEATAGLSLRQRFAGRAYLEALRRLAPDLASIRCAGHGVALDRPWPLRLLGRLRVRAVQRQAAPWLLPATLLPWVRTIMLSDRTLERGYFRPDYLRELVDAYARRPQAAGEIELGLVLTMELWRRLFIDRERDLALPPVEAVDRGPELA